jgi:hypothetical protein
MSWTEINHKRGMSYGGMPYDAITMKLEETDPRLLGQTENTFYDIADEYEHYVRGEIIDWTPDPTTLESDHTKRDTGISKSIMNLRYNGTRGSSSELPRHEDLFYGFTGDDPRGSSTDPRMNEVRRAIETRGSNLKVSMGVNDDHHMAERPWTTQSLSYGLKEVHKRLRQNTKIFSPSKLGRAWGRNAVYSSGAIGTSRREQVNNGSAGMIAYDTTAHDATVSELRGHGIVCEQRSITEKVVVDADFSKGVRGRRVGIATPISSNGAMTQLTHGSHAEVKTTPGSVSNRGNNRDILGMALALATKKCSTLNKHTDTDFGHGIKNQSPQSGATPNQDITSILRNITEGTKRRATGVQDGDTSSLGAGLRPSNKLITAQRASKHDAEAAANVMFNNIEAIAHGLSAAGDVGKIRKKIVSNRAVSAAADKENSYVQGGGLIQSADMGALGRKGTNMDVQSKKTIETVIYKSKAYQRNRTGVGSQATGAGIGQQHQNVMGRTATPGAHNSVANAGRVDPTDGVDRKIEATDAFSYGGGAGMGNKSIRADRLDDQSGGQLIDGEAFD